MARLEARGRVNQWIFCSENLWIGVEDECKASEPHKHVNRIAEREECMGTFWNHKKESMIIDINSQIGHFP